MADFTDSTTVDVPSQKLFDYLSDVANLPKYFARLTSAERGEGEEVETSAQMPDGTEVAGTAWFRVDDAAQRIEWGAEGANDYSGYLDVTPSGGGSQVEVHIHTNRVEDDDAQIYDGIQETLSNIKERVEGALTNA